MPRPRTIASHPREFFAFTEELLTTPGRSIATSGPGPREAFALRAGMYHFWAKLRKELQDKLASPIALNEFAEQLKAAGKLEDSADGALLRALFRVAANTSISIDGKNVVHFVPKSETSLGRLLGANLSEPPESLADAGEALLKELETKP